MEISELATRICDEIGRAVEKYCWITRRDPDEHLPEAFLVSEIQSGLYPIASIAMEQNSRVLWDRFVRQQRRSDPSFSDAPPPEYNHELNRKRADLVFYQGDRENPLEMDLFAIVEVKAGWFAVGDFDKVQLWKKWLHIPFGIVCGYSRDPDEGRSSFDDKSIWVSGRPIQVFGRDKPMYSFARIIIE